MKLVSRCWMRTRMKDISLRVFSKMTRGSSDWHRRQLGAITMARLLTSILVTATLAGCTKTCGRNREKVEMMAVVGLVLQYVVISENPKPPQEKEPGGHQGARNIWSGWEMA